MNKNTILKGILPLAVLPLLFWGCSDDKFGSDSSSGKQISFRLQGNLPSSRATGTTVDNINAFVVNAQTDLPADAGKLFSSQTVARLEGTANAFDYSPKRYYPDAAAFAYYSAYSPVTKNVKKGFNTDLDNKNTITYFVPAPDIDGNTTQEDLLVAYTPVTGKALTSGAAPDSRGGFDQSVSLTFKHALSRVFVRASNNNKEPVVIKELSLHNLYSKGTLKIDGDTWKEADNGVADINEDYIKKEAIAPDGTPAATYKVLWSPDLVEPKVNYPYVLLPTGVSVPAGTEGSPVVGKDQGMLVLPQTTVNSNNGAVPTTATDFFVEVTYRLSNIQRTVRAAFTDINKLPQTDKKEGLTFEMGRQYALTLGFDDTDIKFDISVESWEAEEPELASAATTVVFNGNIPAGVSEGVEVEGIHAANSGFIYGKELPGLTTPPFLVGWIFLGYFDSRDGGTQYYDGSLTPQKVFDTDGDDEPDAVWDKAGPACTLYAQWVKFNPFWGQSNIYFKPDPDGDGSVGSLTFSEDDSSKFGYQGLYFKWGSLIGVSPTGTFNGDAYLYIPDVTTGKYYKVTVSDVKDSSVKAVSDFLDDAVPGWTGNNNGTYPNNDWSRIPYADESYDSGRGLSPLTDASNQAYYTSYKGDICKFLSDKKETNSSKLKRNWVMPISDVWKGDVSAQDYGVDIDGVYRYEKNSNWSGSGSFLPTTDVGGTGSTPTALMTYTATGETASFPASGYRYVDHGALNGVGSSGCYWSSSVGEGSGAHYLYAISSEVRPGIHGYRSWGMSVRCVQK